MTSIMLVLAWSKSISLLRIIYILNLYLINRVKADYCEFGTCTEDQYCCGENKCCQKTIEVWYFWAGILLIAIVIFFIVFILIGEKQRWKYSNYKQLPLDGTSTIS